MWYEKGQIAKGDDIAYRYINIASTKKIEKFDPDWN